MVITATKTKVMELYFAKKLHKLEDIELDGKKCETVKTFEVLG